MSVTLFRNADVDLIQGRLGGTNLILNDSIEIPLSSRHSISRSVASTSIDTVRESLNGGHFCIEQYIDNKNKQSLKLSDWRNSDYSGFIHSDDMIKRMNEHTNLKTFHSDKINIDKYGVGGEFDVTTGFDFNVFKKELDTHVGIVRFICTNGLVVRDSILERAVPIINLYDEHLKIASEMTMQAAKARLSEQIMSLDTKTASVRQVLATLTHINSRLDSDDSTDSDIERLMNFQRVIEGGNLDYYYHENAMKNAAVSDTLPSHLDSYTLYNIITEMRSHTTESARSTERALDQLASKLLLEDSKVHVVSHNQPKRVFVNPEEAFVA